LTQHRERPMRKLPPAVVVGNYRVIHRPGASFERTKLQLAQQEYQVQETLHFLLARSSESSKITLIHRFPREEINNNITDYLLEELGPLMTSDQAFSEALIGIVDSVDPHDIRGAWNLFSLNTFQRLREKISRRPGPPLHPRSIDAFAEIYRRLLTLRRDASLLDVGCACAFWPLLVAEQERVVSGRIVGIDIRQDAINLSSNLALLMKRNEVEFVRMDALSSDLMQLGRFDTVTAIHVFEHLSDEQLPLAFEQLLAVTSQRLIIAVPYEQQATAAYGHEQVFTPEILASWGQRCVHWLGGNAGFWCEEVAGGLLVIDREKAHSDADSR
jgi:2-polyprenyl-3-methyl-5-hydroxy-6-metoxy-1,4-benzoquinol methylase